MRKPSDLWSLLAKLVSNFLPLTLSKKWRAFQKWLFPSFLLDRMHYQWKKRCLIGQFIGIWVSPRSMDIWLQKKLHVLIKGWMTHYFCGRGFYAFLFEFKEDRDLILRSWPYIFNNRGMYTLEFYPNSDIPLAFLDWVRLPHLPPHCWGVIIWDIQVTNLVNI